MCGEYLWSKYGSRDKYPSFDPAAVREIVMFEQSQKVIWFQKCLSSQAAIKGSSETGFSALHYCGIGVSNKTEHRAMHRVSESHSEMVFDVINEATLSGDLLVLMIEDYTNIHTKQ